MALLYTERAVMPSGGTSGFCAEVASSFLLTGQGFQTKVCDRHSQVNLRRFHMRPSSPRARNKQQLSESLLAHVNAYAMAAGAAGVSILALAQSSSAEIVVNPAHGVITPNKTFALDMNHDGIPDFRFYLGTFAYHSFYATLSVKPVSGNGVMAGGGYAYPVLKGYSIGTGRLFTKSPSVRMERSHGFEYIFYYRNLFGPWADVKNGYLGVEFLIDGATHFGWIRMTVNAVRRPLGVIITEYAYETIANKPIDAGQTTEEASAPMKTAPMASPSLGALALGSPGLALWRREDSSLSVQ
jgi:hypothetical protein